ncbi:ABC transporter ATP-binding protein [Roseibium album]|uniref:Putative ABC transporter ATP-binding protein YbhF n=1 Tax=Roseibium album TaxID=311410 RepID=A0A0M7A3W1_9HYPH|nr:ABC transporter ATP-binding protein [Roseibium album]MBG6165601.1 ABC-2 type transport system ATP-binding protein [Labrenzia sp. EL_195]MBG6201862.1 ABC-2 type transport system ATP-binding protein [Labrenzia sp. EL_13]CTQ63212.1 putative ABC transporter ATP-binding protein YbhF [Roseibium album]CTQ69172.1 putative ABC transporter ATP-binding protein YbhF [Roseibium album]CTQ80845.1 putative ABC transporter ATP-binding protein YbhF [Roseibium album]
MTSGLDVRGITHRYGKKTALNDIGFSLDKGTFCALLGPNGAGKSTLFSILTRLFVPDAGEVMIAGHSLAREPGKALARIGVVFQQPTLDLDLTVRRNLKYFAALHGLAGKDADRRIETSLEQVNMAERAGEKVRALNGGHRRRMEIARALLHDPVVLLLDEPTVGLDAETRNSITGHVHNLASEQGLTVLWATHLVDEVRANDQLVVLHEGRIQADGSAAEIAGDTPLQARFLEMTGGGE